MAKYYYDRLRTQILPRDADVNLIIGARGLGKTYGVRRYMLEDYIKNNICLLRSHGIERKITTLRQNILTE